MSIPGAARGDDATRLMLDLFNHAPVWTQAQAPHTTRTVRGHRRHVGSDEQELINSYGENAVELILDVASFLGGPLPEKFDRFTIGAETYTAQAVRVIEGYANTPTVVRVYASGG